MIELIIICVVIAILFAKADKARAQKAAPIRKQEQAVAPTGTGTPASVRETAAAAKPPRKLVIDGTEPFPLSKAGFFSGFGVPTTRLCDARCFTGVGGIDEFPAAVALAVRSLYEEGTAMGAEVMRVAHHGRKLGPGEALYFGLTRHAGQNEEYTMFAFLDRAR